MVAWHEINIQESSINQKSNNIMLCTNANIILCTGATFVK